jgi:hypothetical protein
MRGSNTWAFLADYAPMMGLPRSLISTPPTRLHTPIHPTRTHNHSGIRMIKSVTKARTSAVALLLTMRMRTSTRAWTCTRTGSRRTKGTVEGTGNAEPLTLSAANSPTAHIIAWTTNLPEGVVGGGAGVEVGAGAVGERLLLALMCRTTVANATTTGNPVLSVAVAEGVGVAEDVGVVEGVVERSCGSQTSRRAASNKVRHHHS